MKPLVEAVLYRDAGAVKRYHTKRTLRTQDVAQHTFGMLMLVRQVCPGARKDVYDAILHHDLPELFTGDIPAPIKRASPQIGLALELLERELTPLHAEFNLTADEEALVKWADRMELVLWAMEEFELGNRGASAVVQRGLGWITMGRIPACAITLTAEVVCKMHNLGIPDATPAELEMNI